jgi:hypothetical protein
VLFTLKLSDINSDEIREEIKPENFKLKFVEGFEKL